MGIILFYITLAVVLIVVLVLVVYLLAIIITLSRTNRYFRELAGGLDAIIQDTQPLSDKLGTINDALTRLLSTLLAVDGHLASVAKLLGH